MKKIQILPRFSIIVMLFFCFYFQDALSQTSGWIDKGYYQEEELKIDGIIAARFNESGSIYYTLNSNGLYPHNAVYYWDTESGKLMDSFVIPDYTASARFSKDGHTICYFLPFSCSYCQSFYVYITIYDLVTKTIISKSSIKIPGDINVGRNTSSGYIESYKNFTMLDYNYSENLLSCGITFNYFFSESNFPYHYEHSRNLGGNRVFEVKSDTLLGQSPGATNTIYEKININNSEYKTIFYRDRNNGGTSSLKEDNTEYIFRLNKYDFSDSSSIDIKSGNYNEWNYWEIDHGSESGSSGINKPFTLLFLDNSRNTLYMKSDDIYYKINLNNDIVEDSILFLNSNGLEKLTPDGIHFIYYNKNKLIFHNALTKNIDDSIDCPIEPVSLELRTYGNDIIVANKTGTILRYKNAFSHVDDLKTTGNIFISPNPATDFIILPENFKNNDEISIFSIFGSKVFEGISLNNKIYISFLAPGIYFIRASHKFYKFVKM